ncbi:hypothetical protein RHSIM_RhsimUnG0164600 [Rhododendron simsii]|uniref:Uncharacterized protein n=1 Tax=Rhododendron simsii TaxID=118357 RepID=A0A834FUS4_RHOSS|nr:hypothetical protein RHSIM_RhsimUnG0164600 [Rhododendron simsii]
MVVPGCEVEELGGAWRRWRSYGGEWRMEEVMFDRKLYYVALLVIVLLVSLHSLPFAMAARVSPSWQRLRVLIGIQGSNSRHRSRSVDPTGPDD